MFSYLLHYTLLNINFNCCWNRFFPLVLSPHYFISSQYMWLVISIFFFCFFCGKPLCLVKWMLPPPKPLSHSHPNTYSGGLVFCWVNTFQMKWILSKFMVFCVAMGVNWRSYGLPTFWFTTVSLIISCCCSDNVLSTSCSHITSYATAFI